MNQYQKNNNQNIQGVHHVNPPTLFSSTNSNTSTFSSVPPPVPAKPRVGLNNKHINELNKQTKFKQTFNRYPTMQTINQLQFNQVNKDDATQS